VPDDQTETLAFLDKPGTYGLSGEIVERHATHGSYVFLAGSRAYKLKRAVHFPYMDYSTVARRKVMCERELDVNRRLAPEIYLETVPVMRRADGSLRIGGNEGEAIDWLVVMRRFEQSDLFESRRRRGQLEPMLLRQLGERLARFHESAERQPRFGGAAGIEAVLDENRSLLGPPLDGKKIADLDALSRKALEALRSFLDTRRDRGFVRRVHGDLHLNNICVYNGKPVPFDAIEFEDNFACIDVLFDLALLLMDLDRHGLSREGNIVLNRYLERTRDYEGLKALPLFLSCRAAMRAHVTLAMKQGDPQTREREAAQLLDCALAYLKPHAVSLIAIGGVSGTGKSTVAAAIAPHIGRAPGAVVVRTDVVRKQLWGADELMRLPPAAYDEEFTARVYRTMAERAAAVLNAGHSVIFDAVMGQASQRADIEELAQHHAAHFHGLWLDAPTDILARRIVARRDDASDATVDVLRAQRENIETPDRWTVIDADAPPADVARAALHAIRSS